MSYKKIAQFGSGGNVGQPVFDALVASGKFEITSIGRKSSTFTSSNPSVKVVKIDYENHQEIVDALKGHDVALINLGDPTTLEKNTIAIIDAAVEAGVKRILPSEYGVDLSTPPGSTLFLFQSKRNIHAYLQKKADAGQLEFTNVAVGAFFDWGLRLGLSGFDIANKKATIYNGGTEKVNYTTLAGIAEAVLSVVSNPEPWKNKYVRVHDFFVSQNEILSVLEELTGAKWPVEPVDADKLLADSSAAVQRGEASRENIFGIIKGIIYSSDSASRWGSEDDAAALDVSPKDLKTEIGKVVKA